MSAVRAIECPACGGSIEVKAAGYSVMVGCRYCSSELDVSQADVKLIREFHESQAGLDIPLGRRGTLDGVRWEVIGAQIRSDDEAEWTEYLLFNPYAGYRWLVNADGEWSFGQMVTERPEVASDMRVEWRGVSFTRDYEPVETVTDRVIGEFYWRARAGDSVRATSYSRGRTTLSLEIAEDEVSWTELKPVTEKKVEASFGLEGEPLGEDASTTARLAHDFNRAPVMRASDLWPMVQASVVTALIILLALVFFGGSSTRLESNPVDVAVGGPATSTTITGITVSRPYSFVTVKTASSNFDNRWVDLDFSLVNRKTQQSWDAYDVVERYSGVDSDGSWSEGSNFATTRFGGIPTGQYELIVEARAQEWQKNGQPSPGFAAETAERIAEELQKNGQPSPDSWPTVRPRDNISLWFTVQNGGWHGTDLFLWLCLILGFPILIIWWRWEK